jgi:hypothetical protein
MASSQLRYGLVFFAIIVLPGCYTTSVVQFDVLQPAEKPIYTDINRIGIVNASHVETNPVYSDERIRNRFVFDTITFHFVTERLAAYMGQSPRFDAVIAEDGLLYRPLQDFYAPLKSGLIDSLCRKNNSDALLSLEATVIKDTVFKYRIPQIMTRNTNIEANAYPNSFYTRQVLIARSYWSFYQLARLKMKVAWIQTDTLFYYIDDTILDYDEILSDPETVYYLADELAEVISLRLSHQIAPYWVSADRKYFKSFKNDFMRASTQVAHNDWIKAIDLWRKYEEDPDKKLSAVACFNIAVACEAIGKTDIAITWLEKSINTYTLTGAKEYLDVLKQRQIVNVRLDLQFGIKR